jgi:hypothetical protein
MVEADFRGTACLSVRRSVSSGGIGMNRATVALAALLLAVGLVRSVSAVSATDLLNLQAHGLGDEVLVALIETDGSSFHLSPSDIERLRSKGMRDAVIVAMLEADKRDSRRTAELARRTAEQPPQRPVAIVVAQGNAVIVPVDVPRQPGPAAPIYWGYGGQPNPGSWTLGSQNDESRRARR